MTYLCRWFLVVIAASLVLSCNNNQSHYSGYVEAEYTYVSPYSGGELLQLEVDKGQMVKQGQLLFTLVPQPQLARLQAAKAEVTQAQAEFKDLLTGERPEALAVITAQIDQARAEIAYNKKQYQRNAKLLKTNNASPQEVDLAFENLAIAKAKLQQYQASLAEAQLAARQQQIAAAKAALYASRAHLREAIWQNQQRQITAPIAGRVVDVFHWPGEQLVAQQPVLELLNARKIKALFYIPESQLAQIKLGQKVWVHRDNGARAQAVIHFISPEAEYTPPVIYSEKTQSKLIYEIEADFVKDPESWHPGQPIWVSLR